MATKKILAIVWKDIVAELRTKEMFSARFVFAVLVIVVFHSAICEVHDPLFIRLEWGV